MTDVDLGSIVTAVKAEGKVENGKRAQNRSDHMESVIPDTPPPIGWIDFAKYFRNFRKWSHCCRSDLFLWVQFQKFNILYLAFALHSKALTLQENENLQIPSFFQITITKKNIRNQELLNIILVPQNGLIGFRQSKNIFFL